MMFPQDSLYNPDEDMSRGSSSDFLPPGGGLAHSASSASFDAYSTTCTTDMDNVSLSSQDVGEEEDGALDELANDRPPSDYDSGSESDIESVDNEDGDDERCNDPGVSTSQTSGATDPAGDQIKSGKRKKSVKDGRQKKKKKSKRSFERRNIRKILADKDLEQNTLTAQQEELERKKRISEFKKNMKAQQEAEEKHSHLKSLLDDDQDSDCVVVVSTKRDVVVLSSDEDTKQDSSDDENSGSHVNDMLNKKNENGQVLVNVGHPEDEPDLFLAPQVAYTVKPHQIGGIRFLYDNLVESLSRLHSSPGFGCILAHSMGLGKTIQVVGFVDVLLRCTDMKKILIIVPINTLQNWVSEFNMWLPLPEVVAGISEEDVLPRKFTLHVVNDMHKTVAARAKVIEAWCEKGGVLLMGYEMYRLLSTRKARTRAKPFKMGKNKKPLLIDLDEEDRNQELQLDMQSALLDPGPDLIICDEGHRIKNSHAGISQALKTIRTRRRVVLTGYPLQNNLLEYWCMVDFVRPNFLGTKTEFCNMFERPINNGQCQDSTSKDVQLMRARAHVLHSLLEGFVQRRSHQVLKDALPPKEEYVLLVRMSPVQRVLYKVYMDYLENGLLATESTNPLKAFAVCCKIWNHPDILHRVIQHKQGLIADNDLDLADSESTKSGGDNDKKKKKKASKPLDLMENERAIKYDWAVPLMDQYSPNIMENGGKMVLLFNIIESTLAIGEKVLVFSQSLFTLSTIEEILSRVKVPLPGLDEKWERGKTYYRLDGSTSSMEREKLINQFNEPENKNCCLFLLSTRAGCLGINLVGANRVVVFDASWNPCHDCQAICRVYRYGQVRPCFIYRFVTDNTMEKKIYDRQVNKQGMSDRVVDELQPQNNFTRKEVDTLLQYEDKDLPVIDFQNCAEKTGDPVLCDVLVRNGHWITKEPFTHESLLIDRKDYKLSKAEKRIAKMAYEREKRLNVSYTRPSYSAFYSKPNQPPPPPPQPMLNPIYSKYYNSSNLSSLSSVRPMMSTPIPQPTAPPISRPGVSVQQIITTTEIVLPGTNTASNAGADKIAAGEKVFVIKTPKGVYLRTMSGRIFAVRKNAEKDGGGMVMSQACSGSTQPIMSSSDGPRSNSTSGGSMIQRVLQSTSGLSQQQQLPQQQLPQQQLPQQQLPQQQLPQQQSYLNHDIGMPTSHSELGSPSYPYGMPTMGFNSHPTTQALPASVELLNRQVSAYPGLSRYQMPVQPHDFMSSHNPPSSTQSDGFSSWSNSLLNQDQYNGYNGAPFSAVGSSHQDSVPMSQFPSLSSIGTTHSSSAGVPSDSILRSTLAQNITGYGSQAANCISKRGQPVQDNMTSYASRQSFDNPWSSSLSSPLGSNPSGVLNTIPVTATDSNEVMASAVVTNPSGVMNFAGVTNPSEIKTFGGVANRNGSMTSS